MASPVHIAWRSVAAAAALCLALSASGCGNADAEHEQAVAAARASLASDPSAALFQARSGIAARDAEGIPSDARLELIAAEACIRLDRRTEALDYATNGLTAADLDEDIRADLFWARGAALMGRYRELGDETDWRSANSTLEKATEAGHHRVDAAMALVGLQDLGNHANPERQLKYGRMVIELDRENGAEGGKAALVRRLLESKGLTP
jgi:hypothetical protein